MIFNIFYLVAIIGLLAIIAGNIMISGKRKLRRRYTYPLLILGGICLEVYSIHIGDIVFMVLQGVFIIAAIYGLIRIHEKYHRHINKK